MCVNGTFNWGQTVYRSMPLCGLEETRMIRTREIRSANGLMLTLAAMFGSGFFAQIPKEVFWPYFAGTVALGVGFFAVRNNFVQARSTDKLVVLGPLLFAAPLTAFAAEHFV